MISAVMCCYALLSLDSDDKAIRSTLTTFNTLQGFLNASQASSSAISASSSSSTLFERFLVAGRAVYVDGVFELSRAVKAAFTSDSTSSKASGALSISAPDASRTHLDDILGPRLEGSRKIQSNSLKAHRAHFLLADGRHLTFAVLQAVQALVKAGFPGSPGFLARRCDLARAAASRCLVSS
jgi:hypothetical protein